MRYNLLALKIKKLFAKADIKKKCNPHFFRHSRATFLANHLTEFQMNQYFGWAQGSDMPSTYVHMSGKAVDNALLKLNGLKKNESKNESVLKPQVCKRCSENNPADSKFCRRCGAVLNIDTALEVQKIHERKEERDKNVNDVMSVLMKDKEFQSLFIDKIKALGLGEKII